MGCPPPTNQKTEPEALLVLPDQEPRRRTTILVVDDDPLVCETLGAILNCYGYQVLMASDPSQAMKRARLCGYAVDVMITDVMMPHMNGVELYQVICPLVTDLKVIFMSGHPREYLRKRYDLPSGARLVQKPFFAGEMIQVLRRVLEGGDLEP